MSSGQEAAIAVREERAWIGGVEVAKKTIIAATDEGVIALEINTVETTDSGYGNNNSRAALPSYPQRAALPAPNQVVIADPPQRDCKYYCCACDNTYQLYDLRGKGICWILLLLLLYLIVGVIVLPFAVVFWLVRCLTCNND